jgi:hypothetical protein
MTPGVRPPDDIAEMRLRVDREKRRAELAEQRLDQVRNRRSVRLALRLAERTKSLRGRPQVATLPTADQAGEPSAGLTTKDEVPQALIPILVLSPGRSGSTLLMQLLATSDLIAFERAYPFERRYLTYMLRWALLLEESNDPTPDWDPNRVMNRTLPMRAMPFRDRPLIARATQFPPLWQDAFEAGWSAVSKRMIASLPAIVGDRQGIEPRYYAEKAPRWVRDDLRRIDYDHRIIYLIRDPRDVYMSILSFNERRGASGFGFLDTDTPETYARRFARAEAARFADITAQGSSSAHIVIRYESLVSEPHVEAARIGELLGVRLDPDAALRLSQQYSGHATSKSTDDSLGRWRTAMSAEVKAIFADEMGDSGTPFGYSV